VDVNWQQIRKKS